MKNEIVMEDTVNQRIKILTESSKSMRAFAIKVGIAPQQLDTLVNRDSKPSFETLTKILLANPDVSADWLVLGRGDMYRATEIATGSVTGTTVVTCDHNNTVYTGTAETVTFTGEAKREIEMLLERIREKDEQLREKDKQIAWLMSHADDLRSMVKQ